MTGGAASAPFVPLLLGGDWHHDRPGGLNRYLADLQAALRREGVRTRATVIGPAADAPVGTVAVSSAHHPLALRLWSYSRAAAALADEVDLVDAHFALYACAPAVAGRLRRLPLVVHFQGPWAGEDFLGGRLRGVRILLKRLTEQAVYRRAEAFVTLSAAFKRILVERYGVPPWSVHVIPPGVDLERFRPGDPASARRHLAVAPDRPLAVAVRRLVPRMGLDVLLDAWALVEPSLGAVLLIVGDGPERRRLEAKAAAAGPPGTIAFLGGVDEDTLVACYQAADVSVVPSVALEGFGLVVIESLACGTPVIASDAGGLPEALAPLDPGLIVPAGDARALAARLNQALARSPVPPPTRARCRDYARSFAWPEVVRRHRVVYESAVRPPPRRLRVVFLDHCARLSGGELALLRLIPALHEIDAHVILAEEGPLAARMAQAGISVEVLRLGAPAQGVSRDQVHPRVVPVRAVAASAAHVVRLAGRLRRLKPDIVHTNSLKATVYGGFAARLAGIPVVWHLRDRIAPDYLPPPAVRAIRFLARRVPAAIIANSAATLTTLGRAEPGWTVVPSPVVLAGSARPPERTNDGVLRIGMAGRIAPWKGQHVFLDAFARAFPSGGAEAIIVGAPLFGEDDYARALASQVEALGLGDRVDFRGFREDIESELAHLDVLVHASVVAEPFGQVVVEGMSLGLPVVASDAGGPAEIIEHGVTGLLTPPGDAAALAGCLNRLVADPCLRRRLGDAARHRSRDFGPDRVARQVMDVYRSVAVSLGRPFPAA